jgi:hypothetical protein
MSKHCKKNYDPTVLMKFLNSKIIPEWERSTGKIQC